MEGLVYASSCWHWKGDGKFMAGKGKSSEIYGFSDPDDPVLLEVTGGRGGFLLPKGTYKGQVQFTPVISEGKCTAELTVPSDAVPGQTIHAVMRVRDNAQNPMTSYLRTVITVK